MMVAQNAQRVSFSIGSRQYTLMLPATLATIEETWGMLDKLYTFLEIYEFDRELWRNRTRAFLEGKAPSFGEWAVTPTALRNAIGMLIEMAQLPDQLIGHVVELGERWEDVYRAHWTGGIAEENFSILILYWDFQVMEPFVITEKDGELVCKPYWIDEVREAWRRSLRNEGG